MSIINIGCQQIKRESVCVCRSILPKAAAFTRAGDSYLSMVLFRYSLLLQVLEEQQSAADERLCSVEAEIARTRKESGSDDTNGSEALQNELLVVLTDLAKSSTEVCPVLSTFSMITYLREACEYLKSAC